MMFYPGNGKLKAQPRGIVLIVGSEKNPIGSILSPLINAVASGNSVMVRPSPKAPKSSEAICKFMDYYLDNRFYRCLMAPEVDVDTIATLSFDFICFTGDESTAKKILTSASQNLIPVHLELEKVCPTVVDGSADIENAAMK